jgi:CPA2 family monovalent cation:H+ antiporter-2
MEALLQILLITIFLSIVINALLKRYDVPPIIGYIFAGAIITYSFSLRETSLHILHEIAEFGIAFLMFTIGLEFSIKNFKKLKKEVFWFGALQVILSTLLFAFATHLFFEQSMTTSIIIGSALALSSTAIVLKILNENRDIRKGYGRIVLGILLFQDLAVIPILLMITFFTSTGVSVETMLFNTLVSAVLVLGILVFAGKYLATPFLSFVFDSHSHELFISTVLLIALGTSYIAYHFGFSYSLGAFIGGMLLAETPFKHQIEADLTPFRDMLLGVFFVTVGMQISVTFLIGHLFDIFSLVIVIMVLKGVLIFALLYVQTIKTDALKSAIALSQVGEFSFVVLELARINGLTTKDINQTLIIAVVFSMILTPFIVKNLQRIVAWFVKSPAVESSLVEEENGHIVVLGYGSLGREICRQLKKQGLRYIAIDKHRKFVEESRLNDDPFLLGNVHQKHILHSAWVQNAMAVMITLEDDEAAKAMVESVFHVSPTTHIVVSGRNEFCDLLEDKRVRSFVHEHLEVAKSMITKAITCDTPAVKG